MKKQSVADILDRILGKPTEKQELFHAAQTRYVAYGGAKGGGKSHGVRQKATALCFKHYGIKILIVRKTLAELEKNHVVPLREAYAKFPQQLKPTYNEQKKVFSFPWGSTITLGYCDAEGDVWQYQGQEYDVIFIDEATRLTYFQFYHINSCVRGVNEFPKRTYFTCNPGGPGHFWVKRLFIDKQYHENEDPEDFTFIQAKVWDNAPLFENDISYHRALKNYMAEHKLKIATPEAIEYARWKSDYVKTLKMGSEDDQKAYIDGDWNVFAGVYFGEFDPQKHTVEGFIIPGHWRKSVSLDYGLDMLAALWFATNEYGAAVCYREYLCKDLPVSAAATAILEQNGTDVIREYIAPPDLWSRNRDTGRSTAEIFADFGIPLIKAGNDRVKGWLNVKEWFKIRCESSMMRIFKTCSTLIENIQLLQYDKKKKDDVATEPHDITHAPDALRYWCSRRQLNAFVAPEPEFYEFESQRPHDDGIMGAEVNEDYLDYKCGGF